MPTPWFHKRWYAAYDDDSLGRLYVQGPREHAKSSTVLTYVARRLCEDHHVRIGIISGTDPLAKKFVGELKHELEANAELIADYGGPFVGPTWTEHELVLRDARLKLGEECHCPAPVHHPIAGKDVSVFAVGRGGQISSRHCDVLVLDDVESKDTVRSDLVRADTREWFAREVIPVLSPGGKLIVVGTRKHFDDLYAYVMRTPGFTVLDEVKSVYREDGSPIWPEMWDAVALAARKAELDEVDVLAWPQEYLNTPLPSETQMFWPDRWPTYNEDPHVHALRKNLTIVQFWDLAISEKTTADFTVGWTIGVDEGNICYLLERRRGHFDFERTLHEIGDMGKEWPQVTVVGIEQVAYQAAAVQEALRRTLLPIVPVVPDKDKVTRARLLEARAASKRVYRPLESAWWKDFAPEAMFFPAGAHDDQIDALAGALKLAGWEASTTQWQYGVWECTHCRHLFVWEKGRLCPKCGTRAPLEFPNPEGIELSIPTLVSA